MKSLLNFINEALNPNILTYLNKLKIDFSDTKGMSSNTKTDRYNKAKAQEAKMVEVLSQSLPADYSVKSIEDWCKENKKSYSPEFDSKNGDIVLSDGKQEIFVDLKVAEDDSYLGTPTVLSLVNFSNADNHYYFLSNLSGTRKKVVNAKAVYDFMTSKNKDAFFMTSKYRDEGYKANKEVENLYNKVNLKAPKTQTATQRMQDTSYLSDEDFVSTYSIEKIK